MYFVFSLYIGRSYFLSGMIENFLEGSGEEENEKKKKKGKKERKIENQECSTRWLIKE